MSSDDIFLETSFSPRKVTDSPMDQTPSSPLVPGCEMTPFSPSPTQHSQSMSSQTPPSPSPPPQSPTNLAPELSDWEPHSFVDDDLNNDSVVKEIKVEFFDSNGEKVCQVRIL